MARIRLSKLDTVVIGISVGIFGLFVWFLFYDITHLENQTFGGWVFDVIMLFIAAVNVAIIIANSDKVA